ncbi:MAG: anion permease, partial [Deltaproteobacteria bacterium]|nr:anion permease [Deltaproteobacteria bacterium]
KGEDSIAAICRREGIAPSLYYKWSKTFLQAGKRRLKGDPAEIKDELKLKPGDMLCFVSGLMLLTGCMTLGAAGRSVEFKTLVVIASAIGLEAAVTNSGLSGIIANVLMAIGGDNPHIALAVVFLGCILMDTLTTNVASAALMFPIAMAMAGELGVNFMPFAIVLMIGASCSFISPMGYAANLMVYEPGGYKFTDYAKVGIPLSILVGIVAVLLAPAFFKF